MAAPTLLRGSADLSSGTGTIGFVPSTPFSRPPHIQLTVVRENVDDNTQPVSVCIKQVWNDQFQYFTQNCDKPVYVHRAGDRLNWLAIDE